MNLERIAGRRYAAETILSVMHTSKEWFDSRGGIGTILDNLEQTAARRQESFAAGIREVVMEVRHAH